MALLIHAHVDVTGSSEEREAYRVKVADLLIDEAEIAIEERHLPERLGYDLKMEGGIPFPPFVTASQGLPGVRVTVDWVNAATDERGSATIIDGRLQTTNVGRVGADDNHYGTDLNHVRVDQIEGLRLAFVCIRLGADEYRGYAVGGNRDAVFRVARDPASGRGELLASAGTPDWSERWTFDFGGGACEYAGTDPEPIEDAEFDALAALAEAFAGEWIWFADRPEEEVAIERDRYRSLGIPERAANVKSARLRRMEEQGAGEGRCWTWKGLDPDSEWVRQVLETCWAGQ